MVTISAFPNDGNFSIGAAFSLLLFELSQS